MTQKRPLRLLHISDLHERGPLEGETWRRRRVLGDAWSRNLADLLEDGPIDLVCFTGDAANRGEATEYEAVTPFFTRLLQELGLGMDRLFVVPGNHDIARPVEERTWRLLRGRVGQGADPLNLSRWLAGREAPAGFTLEWRDRVLERQSAYRTWVREGLGRPCLDPGGSAHGRLGYCARFQPPDWPFPLHILGLDTAWLCGDDSDSGRLWLTEDQLMRLATDPDGAPLEGFRLLLMHHPFHELADGAACRRLLTGHIDLVLRGHLHETEVEIWADPDRRVRQLAAGCLYEGGRADHWPNACQLITLRPGGDGGSLETEVRFRVWSARGGHWHDDEGLYRATDRGRLSWRSDGPARENGSNPFDPWTPVAPGSLAGRQSLLRHLATALETGRSVSLVGDWRIGKTSILLGWGQRAASLGRVVVQLSGEGPEGVSPVAFVEAATSLRAPDSADGAADMLAHWAEGIGSCGLAPLLLVDECDGLLGRFEHRFLERLRGMLGRICLVLASRQEIDLIYRDLGRTSPFHNRLQLRWVGLLEPEAADALLQRGKPWLAAMDTDQVRAWAGCHPFYIQLFGWYLTEARLHGEDPEAAMDQARTEAAARLRDLWSVLSERDRDELRETLAGVPARRQALKERGLVTREGRPFGKVLEEWLREERP